MDIYGDDFAAINAVQQFLVAELKAIGADRRLLNALFIKHEQ